MRMLSFPTGQMMTYVNTGKFKAPSDDWQHANLYLAEYELFVMTEGTLYLSYNEERFTVERGEYLLLPPCNSWRKGFKPAYCSFYWLHFSFEQSTVFTPPQANPPHLQKASENNAQTQFRIAQTGAIPNLEKMVVLMKQLQDSVKSSYPSLTLDTMTTNVLTELYGQICLNVPTNSRTLTSKQIYSDIVDFIQLHIAENIRVADIADHFGYNPKYLSHLFSQITGIPLKQFIQNKKIDSANFMLTDTNLPISDIAKELGFPDSHNFSRAYKKSTGLTPSEYRNTFAKRLLYHV